MPRARAVHNAPRTRRATIEPVAGLTSVTPGWFHDARTIPMTVVSSASSNEVFGPLSSVVMPLPTSRPRRSVRMLRKHPAGSMLPKTPSTCRLRLLLLSLLGGMTAAEAQQQPQTPGPEATTRTAVAPTLTDGDRLVSEGDLKGALEVFRTVHRVQPSRQSTQRIAECLDRLGLHGAAYAAFASLLDRYGAELSPNE